MNFWATLDPRYRAILCDIWGVVHDGVRLYPHAAERLAGWRAEGRRVVLLTNAPRSAAAVAEQLDRLGLPRGAWDAIVTSGEAGAAALARLEAAPGFLGTRADRADLRARGLRFAVTDFADLAVTGLDDEREAVADYADDLARWAAAGVRFHCLNPDRLVVRGGVAEPCAGALADAFAALGGEVVWYGKPWPAIYAEARRAAAVADEAILCVGDALATDMLGAAREGLDAVFVQTGIHAGEAWPDDFGAAEGLAGWRPVAIVPGLG